jgi:hypothetical protein
MGRPLVMRWRLIQGNGLGDGPGAAPPSRARLKPPPLGCQPWLLVSRGSWQESQRRAARPGALTPTFAHNISRDRTDPRLVKLLMLWPARRRTGGTLFSPELPLSVLARTRLCGCGTVKRIERPWLGDAVAVMHDLRIVDARGRQEWHRHDRYDRPHLIPPPCGVARVPDTVPLAARL